MRKLKLLGALLAVMAVVASSTISPAMANHWHEDEEDEGLDACFMGTQEVEELVWVTNIFGYEEPEIVKYNVPCEEDDDDDWDDDEDHGDDDDNHDLL